MLRRLVPFIAVVAVSAAVRPSAQSDSARPFVGIFLVDAKGNETKIKGVVTGDTQSHGVAKSVLTQGITKPSYTSRFSGASADVVVTDPRPAFIFRLPSPKELSSFTQSDPAVMMKMMNDGDNMLGGTNPGVFGLAKLLVDGDARIANSKGMETFKLTSSKRSEPHEYDVRVTSALPPGEYALYVGRGMAPNAIWAFSVKAN